MLLSWDNTLRWENQITAAYLLLFGTGASTCWSFLRFPNVWGRPKGPWAVTDKTRLKVSSIFLHSKSQMMHEAVEGPSWILEDGVPAHRQRQLHGHCSANSCGARVIKMHTLVNLLNLQKQILQVVSATLTDQSAWACSPMWRKWRKRFGKRRTEPGHCSQQCPAARTASAVKWLGQC